MVSSSVVQGGPSSSLSTTPTSHECSIILWGRMNEICREDAAMAMQDTAALMYNTPYTTCHTAVSYSLMLT
jgi:hypothetical protein